VKWLSLLLGGILASYFVKVNFLGIRSAPNFETLDLFLLNMGIVFTIVLSEELIFRRGVYEALRKNMKSPLMAIFTQAGIFVLGHFLYLLIPLNFLRMFPVESMPFLFILGIIFGFAYEAAGLRGSVMAHLVVNVMGHLEPGNSIWGKIVLIAVMLLTLNGSGVLYENYATRTLSSSPSSQSVRAEVPSGGLWLWLRDLLSRWISHETYRRWSMLIELGVSGLYGLKYAHDYIPMSFTHDPYVKLGAFFVGTLLAFLAVHIVDVVRNLINRRYRWSYILANTGMGLGIFIVSTIPPGFVIGPLEGVMLGLGVFFVAYILRNWVLNKIFKPRNSPANRAA